jgi:SdpC family antimicrobial peptide
MKTIRGIAQNQIFIFTLIANFLFVSCSTDNTSDNKSSENVIKAENLTGKEIFKSIIFADGALANKIDFVKDHFDVLSTLKTEKEINSFHAAENEAINYLEKNNPMFFENFKQSMLTRDPSVILKSLNEASLALVPLTNQKIAKTGLTVEKIKKNPKILEAANVKKQADACITILFYWAYPGFAIAAVFGANPGTGDVLAKVDNNILADELALSIANNL